MNTAEFLTAQWPTQGVYVIATLHPNKRAGARPYFRHRPFHSIPAAAQWVVENRDNDKFQIFYALHSFAETFQDTNDAGTRTWEGVRREQANAAFTRLLAFDLDVGASTPKQKKYPVREEALKALLGFVKATRLPLPGIVFSGSGVHVYWRLDEDVDSRTWQVTADKLKHLVQHHGMLTDTTTTADASRVLRPIHTWNRKDEKNPVKVEQRKMMPPSSIATIDALLDAALVGLPPVRFTKLVDPSSARDGSMLSLAEGVAMEQPTPAKLLRTCGTMRRMAAEQRTCNGTVWRATMELLRHTTGGAELCHKASLGHPEYDQENVQKKIDRDNGRNQGPPTCGRLELIYAPDSPCKACPHHGSPDSSPIAFARREPDKVLPADIPEPPAGYRRSQRGIEVEVIKSTEDGEMPVWVPLYPYDLYPLRIVDDPLSGRKAIEWHSTVPIKGAVTATLPVDCYVDTNKMISMFAHRGIYIQVRNGKKMGEFVSLYIQELQRHAAEQEQISTWGWDEAHERFILRDGSHGIDGVRPVVFAPGMANSAAGLVKRGTLDMQVQALRFYEDPAYVRQQAVICLAAAAPLFYLTGHFGVLANLSGPSGASKSMALAFSSSHWGAPEKVVLNGTASGMTQNARMGRMATLANLPVILDEVTDMDPVMLKQMAMGVTQAGGRVRNDRDGTERPVPDSVKSTVMILSSNPPLHSILSQNNIAGDAGSMRLLDMACERQSVHTKQQADHHLRLIRENCGHTGPALVDYILKHRREVEAMLHDVVADVERVGEIAPQERFWSTAISMAVLGCRLLRRLNFVSYDADHMLRWFCTEQLPGMRLTVRDAYTDQVAALQAFMAENVRNALRVTVTAGNYSQEQELTGSLLMRIETEFHGGKPRAGQTWISAGAFRSWCVGRRLPYEAFIRELLADNVVFRERMNLGRHIIGQNVGVATVLRVNLKHRDMAEPEDANGTIVDFRKNNGPKAMVS